jgi:hypothetical protein
VVVRWPSGTIDQFERVAADQKIVVREGATSIRSGNFTFGCGQTFRDCGEQKGGWFSVPDQGEGWRWYGWFSISGQTVTQKGVLRLASGLTLTDHLDVETAGMDGSTRVQIDGSLNPGAKTL